MRISSRLLSTLMTEQNFVCAAHASAETLEPVWVGDRTLLESQDLPEVFFGGFEQTKRTFGHLQAAPQKVQIWGQGDVQAVVGMLETGDVFGLFTMGGQIPEVLRRARSVHAALEKAVRSP